MQTTLRFEDRLMRDAKAAAAQEGLSLTKFIETTLRRHLYAKPPAAADKGRRVRLPVSTAKGWLNPEFPTLKDAIRYLDDQEAEAFAKKLRPVAR